MAIVEFKNLQTTKALEVFLDSPSDIRRFKPKRLNVAPRVAYQKWKNGKPVFTLITRD